MRRAVFIACALLICLGTMSAQAMLQLIVNFRSAVAYTGPGDIVVFTSWYGARAYSSATRGNKAMNVCNVSDVACADFLTDSSTGNLVVTTVGGSNCSSVTCTVKTLYDQTGNGRDLAQATIANRPTLVVSCLSALPCLQFVRASSQRLAAAGNETLNTPVSYSAVAIRTGTTGSFNEFFTTPKSEMVFANSANLAGIFGTADITVSASDNSWHAINAQANNTCNIYVDGSTNSGTCGTDLSSRTFSMGSFNGTATNPLDGKMTEAGVISNVAITSTNAANLNSNQHTYWGF